MARQQLLKLSCDYCGNTSTFDAGRTLTSEETQELEQWVEVRIGQDLKQYDRTLCALNGLKVLRAANAGVIVAEGEA